MPFPIIFAHVSGGTYRMEVSRQQVAPNTFATVRKPISVVSDATRAHEYRADLDSPRTRAATIWCIEHRDDFANTIF